MPRAVVVDHQIVDAQHLRVAHDGVLDVLHQLWRGAFAQQGAEGVHHKPPTRPEDERRHCHAHEAVQHVPARQVGEDGGQEHGAGGQHVVPAVGGGGHQSLGVDALADGLVEAAHPELDADGRRQHPHTEPAEHHCRRMQHFEHRFFQQRKPDGEDGDADHETRQIFVPGVAVGVLFVRTFGRQTEAHEAHHVGRGVREVVQGVGHDGDGAEQRPRRQLAQTEQEIAGHAHEAGQIAVGRADGGVLRIVRVPDEQADEQLCHKIPSQQVFRCYQYSTALYGFEVFR